MSLHYTPAEVQTLAKKVERTLREGFAEKDDLKNAGSEADSEDSEYQARRDHDLETDMAGRQTTYIRCPGSKVRQGQQCLPESSEYSRPCHLAPYPPFSSPSARSSRASSSCSQSSLSLAEMWEQVGRERGIT